MVGVNIPVFPRSWRKVFQLLTLEPDTSRGLVISSVQFNSSVVSNSFVTPRAAACQASLSITNTGSLLKSMSTELVMASYPLILYSPILILPSIFPSIGVFPSESVLHNRCPKYWRFCSASVLPKNTQDWFPSELTGLISLLSKGLSRVFSNTTVQKHQFFGAQLSL